MMANPCMEMFKYKNFKKFLNFFFYKASSTALLHTISHACMFTMHIADYFSYLQCKYLM